MHKSTNLIISRPYKIYVDLSCQLLMHVRACLILIFEGLSTFTTYFSHNPNTLGAWAYLACPKNGNSTYLPDCHWSGLAHNWFEQKVLGPTHKALMLGCQWL